LAVSLENTDNEKKRDLLVANIVPLAEALPELPAISIDQALVEKLRVGYQPEANALGINHFSFLSAGDMVRFISPENRLVAIGKMLFASDQMTLLDEKKRVIKILRVFNDV
jgi:tRNA U55 pseudouridine synthase TruB